MEVTEITNSVKYEIDGELFHQLLDLVISTLEWSQEPRHIISAIAGNDKKRELDIIKVIIIGLIQNKLSLRIVNYRFITISQKSIFDLSWFSCSCSDTDYWFKEWETAIRNQEQFNKEFNSCFKKTNENLRLIYEQEFEIFRLVEMYYKNDYIITTTTLHPPKTIRGR